MKEKQHFNENFLLIKKLIFDKFDFKLLNFELNSENVAYGACSFELNGKKVHYRESKITPTKSGQFVSIWKRNKLGLTESFNISDDLEFIIISSKNGNDFGLFIFPKTVLIEKEIISNARKVGKRGIRVYPPWDIVSSKQASKTQKWQSNYFFVIKRDNSIDVNLDLKLLTSISI